MGQVCPDGSLLARNALDWLLVVAHERGTALAWTGRPDGDELDPTLYSGTAGIVLAFLEGYQHFRDDRYAEAAARGARTIVAAVGQEWGLSSLYLGLAGMAFALRAVHDMLGDRSAGLAAVRALDLVRSRFDGERWGDQFELLGGNAGIALGAARAGGPDLAVLAVTPYLAAAEPTAGGVHWEVRAGVPARFHHMSHGTLGIVYALAAIGHAAGRGDLIELALAGAADVVSRNEADPAGFLVPHSDPQHKPELIERYSYGWCHGPAGDAQAFRLLAQVTGDPAWRDLADRCWHTVLHSGLPNRLRPGFWDNSGRCCGTAGVLALACDRMSNRQTNSPSPTSSPATSPRVPPWTPTAPAGATTNPEPARAPWHRVPDGRWATPAPEEAAGEVKTMYDKDLAAQGYVANFTRAFSGRPEVLQGWLTLKNAITSGMDPRLYELATVATATAIRSSYCSLVHGRILAASYYSAGQVESIAENDVADALDAADAAVVRFARKVAEAAEKITQEDVDELRDFGFSDVDVFNVIVAAAARCFFSKVLDATGTLPDAALHEIPDQLRSALTVGREIASGT